MGRKFDGFNGTLVAWSWGVLGWMMMAAGTQALVDRPEYQSALRASAEGQHEVAAVRFERLWNEKGMTGKAKVKMAERLVDAWLRSGQGDRALSFLEETGEKNWTEWGFYRGQALLLVRRFRDAELQLKAYLESGGKHAELARMAMAKSTIAQGRENPGRRELQDLMSSKDAGMARRAWLLWNESDIVAGRAANVLKRLEGENEDEDREVLFLRGCAWMQTGETRRALSVLRSLAKEGAKSGINKRLRDSAQVRMAEAFVLLGNPQEAERTMLRFLNEDAESDAHEPAFAVLDGVRMPESEATLTLPAYERWSKNEQVRSRHALALYYLALNRMEGKRHQEAMELLEEFFRRYPLHERANEALRLLMGVHGTLRNDARVLELANEWRRRYGTGGEDMVDYLAAMVFFERQEFPEAMELFERASNTAHELTLGVLALYNKAVCATRMGQEQVYRQCMAELSKPESVLPESNARNMMNVPRDQAAHLLIERGLALAAQRDVAAETTLQEFIGKYPQHPRLAEAHLALAEFCLLSVPTRARTARTALDAAQKISPLPEVMLEALEYARLWLCEAEGNLAELAEVGNAYLKNWPKSTRRDEVRMKMAQAFYRLEDFAKAEAEFELVEQETPGSPFAEVALFFAGKSAMNLPTEGAERALTLWAQVVEMKGPLAREAQRQQAAAKRRQGKESEALPVIDNLLLVKDLPVEERHSLLLERGELLELLGRTDAKRLEEAQQVFEGVAEDVAAKRETRCRAWVMLARCYRQAGRNAEALEAYYKVVEACLDSVQADAMNPLEYQWFYRAGFAALDLMEEGRQWQAAADLADRMVAVGGERATEAESRATRIRLEHFLWEEK
ncbi:tetratricopeptide repeat protein [Phragmitibacter flavus]|uniref:tetratricopeptide repeat protein n=1 Tax=Phragmitibacter flavus TaxID=2576071 RepID=UPI00140CB30B|nr:tetratricopeptide repeat protein [Phragmitibacter flavus]